MNTFFDFPLVYLPEFFFAIGIVLLIDRNHISRIQHFVLFFLGIGCVATSLLLFLGTIPLAVGQSITRYQSYLSRLCYCFVALFETTTSWCAQRNTRMRDSLITNSYLFEPISRTSPGSYRHQCHQSSPYKDVALEAGAKVEVVSAEVLSPRTGKGGTMDTRTYKKAYHYLKIEIQICSLT